MKLRNKKTGEIIEAKFYESSNGVCIYYEERGGQIGTRDSYSSLAEFNKQWEDAPEEPKMYWYMSNNGALIRSQVDEDTSWDINRKQIGNYFESEEEAEKAKEKIKAFKRLKDKGFEFDGWRTWEDVTGLACFDKGVAHSYYAGFTFRSEDRLEKDKQTRDDLDLLFGDEE